MYAGLERRQLPGYFQALSHPTRLRILERLAEGGEVFAVVKATEIDVYPA